MLEPVKRKIAAGRGKYWLYFFISTALMFAFMVYQPGWFWVWIPFVCTYLVEAFDAM